MFDRIRFVGQVMWLWFRRLSGFVQMLLVVPIGCAVLLTVFVGNMGLALLGTAVALSAPVVGGIAGFVAVVFGKSAQIVLKDRKQNSESRYGE